MNKADILLLSVPKNVTWDRIDPAAIYRALGVPRKILGMRVRVDPDMEPHTIELRNDKNRVVGKIVNLG